MNINMDDELREIRNRFNTSERGSPLSMWVLIIAIGVFLGATASTLSIRVMDNAIVRYELHKLNQELAAEQEKMRIRQEERNKINAVKSKKQRLENEKKQAGYRQAMETCNFWRDQYRKEPSNSNQYQREQSCNFVNEFR